MKNRSIAIDGSGKAYIAENDLPGPGEGQVQVAMAKSQISVGTEMMGVIPRRKKPDPSAAPMFPGYSIAGTVKAVGANVTKFAVGDRVMAMGAGQATHALFSNVNQNLTMKLPGAMSFEDGANVALAITAMHAVRRLDPEFGRTYIIAGLGIVGQFAAQILTSAGCSVIGLDISDFRLKKALSNGMHLGVKSITDDAGKKAVKDFTEGDGVDGGIICFGGDGTDTLKGIYNLMMTPPDTHRTGPIVVVGGATFSIQLAAALGNIDIRSAARTGPGYKDEVWEKGRDYPQGWVRWDTQHNMRVFRDYVLQKRMNVASLATHTYKLDEAAKAYDAVAENTLPDALGIFFEP